MLSQDQQHRQGHRLRSAGDVDRTRMPLRIRFRQNFPDPSVLMPEISGLFFFPQQYHFRMISRTDLFRLEIIRRFQYLLRIRRQKIMLRSCFKLDRWQKDGNRLLPHKMIHHFKRIQHFSPHFSLFYCHYTLSFHIFKPFLTMPCLFYDTE